MVKNGTTEKLSNRRYVQCITSMENNEAKIGRVFGSVYIILHKRRPYSNISQVNGQEQIKKNFNTR